MRKQMFKGALVCCVLALTTVPLWAQGGPRQGMCLLATEPAQALEPAEARELAYIREEEKLAMDFMRPCRQNGACGCSTTSA